MRRSSHAQITSSIRIGKVVVYSRGQSWYLRYHQDGVRHQIRSGQDKSAARQLAARVNADLECGARLQNSLRPMPLADIRQQWLDHHEHVRRSSLQTINRYRAATEYLMRFIESHGKRYRTAASFSSQAVDEFVRWLRAVEVSPNGHPHSNKRRLLDKGVNYILKCCRTLLSFAIRRRLLPPYSENPFAQIGVDSIAIENAKPIILLSAEQEQRLLNACDDWEFPILLMLICTGLRPGELARLLLPDDLDLDEGLLRVTGKPRLGWQIKTRCDRDIPLHPAVSEVLRSMLGGRNRGPVFMHRMHKPGKRPELQNLMLDGLEREAASRIAAQEKQLHRPLGRAEVQRLHEKLWSDLGAINIDVVRHAFLDVCARIGLSYQTAPKVLRHGFATMLQDANVDPIVRNLLMGHSTTSSGGSIIRPVGLGMTATYTHTRGQTLRRQLFDAIAQHGVLPHITRLACGAASNAAPQPPATAASPAPPPAGSDRPACCNGCTS